MSESGTGLLLVLSGPSGVGKDTVLRRLMELEPGLRYSVSYTTRPPRPGEVDGVSYSFVDDETFTAMAAGGRFLEWAEVHGNRYGTSTDRVAEALEAGDDVVLKIDVQGAARVRSRLARDGSQSGGVFVFLQPPSLEILRDRLLARETEPGEVVAARLHRAAEELAEAPAYDHEIVNDDVDRAARELLSVLRLRHAEIDAGGSGRSTGVQ